MGLAKRAPEEPRTSVRCGLGQMEGRKRTEQPEERMQELRRMQQRVLEERVLGLRKKKKQREELMRQMQEGEPAEGQVEACLECCP